MNDCIYFIADLYFMIVVDTNLVLDIMMQGKYGIKTFSRHTNNNVDFLSRFFPEFVGNYNIIK